MIKPSLSKKISSPDNVGEKIVEKIEKIIMKNIVLSTEMVDRDSSQYLQ